MPQQTANEVINYFEKKESQTRVYLALLQQRDTAYALYARNILPETEKDRQQKEEWHDLLGKKQEIEQREKNLPQKGRRKTSKKTGKGRPPREPYNRSHQTYQHILTQLNSKGYVCSDVGKIVNGRRRVYFRINNEVIESVIRFHAFTTQDASINEDIYLLPSEPKRQQYPPSKPQESWWREIDRTLRRKDNVGLIDTITLYESDVLNHCIYYDTREPVNKFLDESEGIKRLIWRQLGSRINAWPALQEKADISIPFHQKQLLTHLCILPYLGGKTKDFPLERINRSCLGLRFPEVDLTSYWDDIVKFVNQHEKDHFIPKLFGSAWEQSLPQELIGYTGKIVNELKNQNKKPKLQELPFEIQITGRKSTICKKLTTLQKFLDANTP